jgi:phospholipase C
MPYPALRFTRKGVAGATGAAALAVSALTAGLAGFGAVPATAVEPHPETATPIKHVVVIFQENVSFDHYFATYPKAANTAGETQQGSGTRAAAFTAAKDTPNDINTLANAGLLAPNNPNSVQPERLSPMQAVTCDQDHGYSAEQKAYNGGAMDKFVQFTSRDACGTNQYGRPGLTMDYYDGNTVTGIWNYAQNYAMSDNHFSTVFGPSTPGALNLISGQTHGAKEYTAAGQPVATPVYGSSAVRQPDANGVGTVINDPDPVYDDCSNSSHAKTGNLAGMTGRNIGDLLNAKGVSWGWFQGGFTPTTPATAGNPASCLSSHTNAAGASVVDYSPHHQPWNWDNTAVVLAYDDSDGWYDHVAAKVKNSSNSADDAAWCQSAATSGVPMAGGYADRCGPGPRQPLVVISPYVKKNFVDHTETDQASILRFIEDNWNTGRIGDASADAAAGSVNAMFNFHHQRNDKVLLNEQTGAVVSISHTADGGRSGK